MSNNYGPRIVTDGLVLCLDAADRNSYAGSGTTWTDLSGNGNNGTLINGTGYNSGSGGALSFDGTNDYVNAGNNSSINFGTGSFTVSLWFRRFSSSTTNLRLLSKGAAGDFAISSYAGFCFLGGNDSLSFLVNPTSTRVGVLAATYSLNEWVNVVGLVERGVSLRSYKNGEFVQAESAPTGSVTGTSQLRIGNNGTAGVSNLYWKGEIANVNLYNRALTVVEIQQNYNATKGRFGL